MLITQETTVKHRYLFMSSTFVTPYPPNTHTKLGVPKSALIIHESYRMSHVLFEATTTNNYTNSLKLLHSLSRRGTSRMCTNCILEQSESTNSKSVTDIKAQLSIRTLNASKNGLKVMSALMWKYSNDFLLVRVLNRTLLWTYTTVSVGGLVAVTLKLKKNLKKGLKVS